MPSLPGQKPPVRAIVSQKGARASLLLLSFIRPRSVTAAERSFWERQIRVAKGLNWITLFAGIVAVGGLVALYRSITDAEDATIRANRAWLMADHVSIIPGTNAQKMKTI
jgi:hypothetical protein